MSGPEPVISPGLELPKYSPCVTRQSIWQRVAAMLAAYEARSIDAYELHARLLKALQASGSADTALRDLFNSVGEATDLGRNEREDVAWAAAKFWKVSLENS